MSQSFGSNLKPVEIPHPDGNTTSAGTTPTFSPANKPTPLIGSWADIGWEKHGEPTSATVAGRSEATPLLNNGVSAFEERESSTPQQRAGTDEYLNNLLSETARIAEGEESDSEPPKRSSTPPPDGSPRDSGEIAGSTTYGKQQSGTGTFPPPAGYPAMGGFPRSLQQRGDKQADSYGAYQVSQGGPAAASNRRYQGQGAPLGFQNAPMPPPFAHQQHHVHNHQHHQHHQAQHHHHQHGSPHGNHQAPFPPPHAHHQQFNPGPYAAGGGGGGGGGGSAGAGFTAHSPVHRDRGSPTPQLGSSAFGGQAPHITKFTPPPPPNVALANELAASDSDTPPDKVGDVLFSLGRRWVQRLEGWLNAHPRERPSAPCPAAEQYATIETWLEKLGAWYQANFNSRKVAGRGRGRGGRGGRGRGSAPSGHTSPSGTDMSPRGTSW